MRIIVAIVILLGSFFSGQAYSFTTHINTHFVSEYGVSGDTSPSWKTLETVANSNDPQAPPYVSRWGLLQVYDPKIADSPLVWGNHPDADSTLTKFETVFTFYRSSPTGVYPNRIDNVIAGAFERNISIYYIDDDAWRPTNPTFNPPLYIPSLTLNMDFTHLLTTQTVSFAAGDPASIQATFNLLSSGNYNAHWWSHDKADRAISLAMVISSPSNSMVGWGTPLFDELPEYEVKIDVTTNPSAPVPEPATMLLFGAGIAGLAAVGRRKRS